MALSDCPEDRYNKVPTIWKFESNVSVATACPKEPVIRENAPAVSP